MQLCEELELSFSHREHKRHKGHKGNESENNNNTHIPDILFHGPAFGDEKKELLNSADAFILPSLSEGLPMSVLEAWAYGLPVVMTPECNLPEGFDAGAAVRITTGLEGVAGGLDELFSMSDSDLRSMGARGRELVRGRFTWQTVATQMREVYEWTLGAGAAPSCVRIK